MFARARRRLHAARQVTQILDRVQHVDVHETGLDHDCSNLALALGVPLLVPAFYTVSNITVLDQLLLRSRMTIRWRRCRLSMRGQRVDCGSPEGSPSKWSTDRPVLVGLPHVIDVSEAEAKPNRGIDRAAIEEAVRQAAIVL